MGCAEVILIDTHIWVWWVWDATRLRENQRQALVNRGNNSIGVSIISCWEVAKLAQIGKLHLPFSVSDWLDMALGYPGITPLNLTTEIVLESTRLPDGFRSDPADEIIVATARVHQCELVTSDAKIRSYPHVSTIY